MTDKQKRTCKGCSKDISHKHPNAKFHSKKCKDDYWNRVNPRGLGVTHNNLVEAEQDHVDDYDGSWDAHNY